MINFRKTKPKDYHCSCKYCKKFYKGELIKKDGSYYSARKREGYSLRGNKHICPGHWQGYQFVIERYSKRGDKILDPFAGSGTALVEGAKLKRKCYGAELEFYEISKENCFFYPETTLLPGDIRDNLKAIPKVDLILTGPPYNNNSDAPERKNLHIGVDRTFNYSSEKNLAFLKDPEYFTEIEKIFIGLYSKLKKKGKFVMIIKDPIRKKNPYLLHYYLSKIGEKVGFKVCDVFIHRHYPPTLFINTYRKRFPGVKIPLYQTIIVLKKI